MNLIDKIDIKLNENFAKGKDAAYLAGYMVTMFKHHIKTIESASKVGNYAIINTVLSSSMNDLKAIKAQMDHISKTGSEK
jgi:hypothetical protein